MKTFLSAGLAVALALATTADANAWGKRRAVQQQVIVEKQVIVKQEKVFVPQPVLVPVAPAVQYVPAQVQFAPAYNVGHCVSSQLGYGAAQFNQFGYGAQFSTGYGQARSFRQFQQFNGGFVPQAQFAPSGEGGQGLRDLLGLAATGAGAFGGASVGGPVGAIFGGIAGQAVGEVISGRRR